MREKIHFITMGKGRKFLVIATSSISGQGNKSVRLSVNLCLFIYFLSFEPRYTRTNVRKSISAFVMRLN